MQLALMGLLILAPPRETGPAEIDLALKSIDDHPGQGRALLGGRHRYMLSDSMSSVEGYVFANARSGEVFRQAGKSVHLLEQGEKAFAALQHFCDQLKTDSIGVGDYTRGLCQIWQRALGF